MGGEKTFWLIVDGDDVAGLMLSLFCRSIRRLHSVLYEVSWRRLSPMRIYIGKHSGGNDWGSHRCWREDKSGLKVPLSIPKEASGWLEWRVVGIGEEGWGCDGDGDGGGGGWVPGVRKMDVQPQTLTNGWTVTVLIDSSVFMGVSPQRTEAQGSSPPTREDALEGGME